MQKTSFPFEVLVHDDASTDYTAQIIREYEAKYPHLFRCVYQTENQFKKQNTLVNILFPMARGKYIALCEGDDYWTDPNKLQKQVDFLEANPDFAGSYHQTKVILEDGSERGDLYGLCNKDYLSTEETISTASPFHTSSFVFRNYHLVLPEWFYNIVSGDMALFSIVSSYGFLKNIPEVMSVYRKHDGGITESDFVKKPYHQKRIELIEYLDSFHKYKFHSKALEVIEYHKKEITAVKNVQQSLYDHMHANFINPKLSKANLDTYCIRTAIFNFIKNNLSLFEGILLDVGCGEMPYRDYLTSSSNIENYVGLELERSLNYGDIKPDFHWDGIKMPFEDNHFDTVLLTEVLEHTPFPQRTLNEIYRVLKTGAVLVGTVPFLWPLHEVPHDEYRYTPFALERILKECNFREIQIKALGGWNASLAQFLGLWANRSNMRESKKKIIRIFVKILIKYLLNRDLIPKKFTENTMLSGIAFIAKK